jgi:hypothetical protein
MAALRRSSPGTGTNLASVIGEFRQKADGDRPVSNRIEGVESSMHISEDLPRLCGLKLRAGKPGFEHGAQLPIGSLQGGGVECLAKQRRADQETRLAELGAGLVESRQGACRIAYGGKCRHRQVQRFRKGRRQVRETRVRSVPGVGALNRHQLSDGTVGEQSRIHKY